MNNQVFMQHFSELPEKAKEEVLLFLEFLKYKYKKTATKSQAEIPKKRTFGIAKGDYKMQSNFEDELENFKLYMPE